MEVERAELRVAIDPAAPRGLALEALAKLLLHLSRQRRREVEGRSAGLAEGPAAAPAPSPAGRGS
jgi:hypothetical protein